MQKIIRERYENGELVSREIEVRGIRWGKAAKLLIQLIIALSLAVLAFVAVHDSLMLRNQLDTEDANTMEYSCPADGAREAT